MPFHDPGTRPLDPTSNTTRSGGADLADDGRTTSHDVSARTPTGPKRFQEDNTAPPARRLAPRPEHRQRPATCALSHGPPQFEAIAERGGKT
jgi:hypothetical protein